MTEFRRSIMGLALAFTLLAAIGCGEGECIRHSECGSGLVCEASRCVAQSSADAALDASVDVPLELDAGGSSPDAAPDAAMESGADAAPDAAMESGAGA